MSRRLLAVLVLLASVSGCASAPPETDRADGAPPAVADPLTREALIRSLVVDLPVASTVVEEVRPGRAVDLLGLTMLADATGTPVDPRMSAAVARRASEELGSARDAAWADVWVLSTFADTRPGTVPARALRDAVASAGAPQGGEWVWAAATSAVTSVAGLRGVPRPGCARVAGEVAGAGALRWRVVADRLLATRRAPCPELVTAVHDKTVAGRPSLPDLLRLCALPECAGEAASVRRFVADGVASVLDGTLAEWGALGGADLAALAVLAGRAGASLPEGSAAYGERVRALAMAGGLPATVAEPSDLGLLIGSILMDRAGVAPGGTQDPAGRSITGRYALTWRTDPTGVLADVEQRDRWTPEDWFVVALEHDRTGRCPQDLSSGGHLRPLRQYAADPGVTSMQMAARAVATLRACGADVPAGLEPALLRTADQVIAFERSGRESLSLRNLWAVHVARCSVRGTDIAGDLGRRAGAEWLERLFHDGLPSWSVVEFFAAEELAATDECEGISWFD